MKNFFSGVVEFIVIFHLIFLVMIEWLVNIAGKLFIIVCNIVAILNLAWMALSFIFLFFSFFIKGDNKVLDPTDWGSVSGSFFDFYCHPHGVLRICLVCVIIIITLWRWIHFFLNMKFVKENYIK